MYLLLFISVLFKFADGCVDVYLFSILERNDECVLEFVRNATFAAQQALSNVISGISLSVSKPYAYKLIKKLNDELKEQGFITIAGRVNRQYFQERLYGAGKGME